MHLSFGKELERAPLWDIFFEERPVDTIGKADFGDYTVKPQVHGSELM